jgi:hypothetical protein
MPYKRKEDKAAQMRRWRKQKKQLRMKAERELLTLITETPQIEQKIPSLLNYVLGRKKRKRKREK